MISNNPEYLIEEVRNRYGIDVPRETAITYLDSDPNLSPESLFDYVSRYSQQEVSVVKLNGYKFINFEKDEIPYKPGVYIWLLKDNAGLPSIEGYHPQYSLTEVNGKSYRVLYIGQTKSKTLGERIVKNHLKGDPRHSTLCWSLCAIMGMPYIINEDDGKPYLDNDNKTKVKAEVANWLRSNCHILYKVIESKEGRDDEEFKQIQLFTPPLNLEHNPLKKTDPYIQGVSKFRHISGGHKISSQGDWTMSNFLPYIIIAVSIIAMIYFSMN